MGEKDRLCLITFSSNAKNFYNLEYLTKKNKEILEEKEINLKMKIMRMIIV